MLYIAGTEPAEGKRCEKNQQQSGGEFKNIVHSGTPILSLAGKVCKPFLKASLDRSGAFAATIWTITTLFSYAEARNMVLPVSAWGVALCSHDEHSKSQ
jgi:hypothetical protein